MTSGVITITYQLFIFIFMYSHHDVQLLILSKIDVTCEIFRWSLVKMGQVIGAYSELGYVRIKDVSNYCMSCNSWKQGFIKFF